MGWGRWAGLAVLAAGVAASSAAQQNPREMVGPELSWIWEQGGPVSNWSVPAMNMAPTLLTGDRMAAVKTDTAPKRGDIWIFRHSNRPDLNMVKRVIGLPGDTVEMRNGRLVLNGQEIPRTEVRIVNYIDGDFVQRISAIEYGEQLPGEEKPHLIHEFFDNDSCDDTPVFKVPDGHFFMMGDNRDNSEDSRAPTGHRALFLQQGHEWSNRPGPLPSDTRDDAIGFVPADNLIARVLTITLSLRSCAVTEKQRAAGDECLAPNIGKHL